MNTPTIAFSVQVGSDGFAVARQVADRLNYSYYDWKITAQARNLAEPDFDGPAAGGLAERMLGELLAAAAFEQEIPPAMLGTCPDMLQQAHRIVTLERHREHVEQIVWELAMRGRAVIVGHGSQAILMGQQQVLRVLVVCPFRLRVEQLARAQGSPLSRIEETLQELDEMKRSYLSRTYGIDWLNVSHYDLVINTGEVPAEMAVSLVMAAATANKGPGLMSDDPRIRSIESDNRAMKDRHIYALPDAA